MNYDDFEIVAEPKRRPRYHVEEKDKVLLEIFERVAGEDGVIDAFELRDLLEKCFRRELGEYKFNLETSRSMVLLFDQDLSACIEFDEFLSLWNEINTSHKIFREHDKDKSNDMDSIELSGALKELNVEISAKTLAIFVKRYANSDGNIHFDDFLQIIARTKCLTRSFDRQLLRSGDIGKNPKARFTLDAYLGASLVS